MSVVSVVAPQTPQRNTPYLSVDMFKTHRQGGVQVGNLVNGGEEADQDAALAAYIEEGCKWVDDLAQQSFCALPRVWAGYVNINSRGYAVVSPPVRPVVGVLGFSVGSGPDFVSPLSSLAGIIFGPSGTLEVPVMRLALTSSEGPIQFGAISAPSQGAYGLLNYVGGYAVTQLTADVAQGATSLSLAETAGIVAGKTQLTVHAGRLRFSFIAGAVSTADAGGLGTGAGTVVCPAVATDISNSANYPVFVTSMPASLIEASVLATRALIKQKGSGAVAAQSAANRSAKSGTQNAGDDYAMACDIVMRYLNPVGDMQA